VGSAPTKVMEFDEALAAVLEQAGRVMLPRMEIVALESSCGRVLAEDVRADHDQPPFHRSTRDGFAVRAAYAVEGRELQIAGKVRAGEMWRGEAVQEGTAVEIMTGAPLPAGADAVVMVEHVDRAASSIKLAIGRSWKPGENVVPRGAEARADERVLTTGTVIGAAEIAVAAACGKAELPVFTKPSVAIVATGDELVEITAAREPWQIRNSNSYSIQALVREAGGAGERLKPASDVREDIRARVAEARTKDLMVLSGGVSMGEYDLVEEVLAEFDAEFFFTGVRMQPGKPVVFGRLPDRSVGSGEGTACYFFGLPGNPVSTQVTFHCFVEPMLRALCGAGVTKPRFAQATLAEDVAGNSALTRVLPARLTHDRARPKVKLVGWQGSGDVSANARANCYAVLPPEVQRFNAGDVITVLLR
jgi:molybdopterin molybdotransferase